MIGHFLRTVSKRCLFYYVQGSDESSPNAKYIILCDKDNYYAKCLKAKFPMHPRFISLISLLLDIAYIIWLHPYFPIFILPTENCLSV